MEVHVDASLHGLGGALVQDGKPVAYASKALTPTEQHYANIKRERATCHCIWSRTFSHICLWPNLHHSHGSQAPQADPAEDLADTPVCLQWMLMCLQGYDCTISYCPGKEMLLADTLSRYAPVAAKGIALDTTIHHVHIGTSCKASYQELTCTDPLLCTLAETILPSWPEDPKDVPHDLHGKGGSLNQIHEGHQGITKCQLHEQNCVCWPGINKDVRCVIKACKTCQCFRPHQPHALLKPTPLPTQQWQCLGTDLFQFNQHEYLVIAHYYSHMPIIQKVPHG